MTDGQLVYLGMGGSTIQFTGGQWSLATSRGVAATSTSSRTSLLLGSREWRVEGEVCGGEDTTTTLKLTGCGEEEFTCGDGQCVSMEQRCPCAVTSCGQV